MPLEDNIDYALARVQAQYGRRLRASDWRRIEASRDLAQYLGLVRSGTLADWVSSIDLSRDVHAIERSLRTAWRRYIEHVAGWHPLRWQAWLAWLEWLPTLGLLAQLARPESAPAWLMADPVCGPVASRDPAERPAALQGTALAVFEPAISGRLPLGALWLARWHELQPPADTDTLELLAAASNIVKQHTLKLAMQDAGAVPAGAVVADAVSAGAASAGAVALRQQLSERLSRMYRAAAATVVATLCHLALAALDFERLRGGLVSRSLFAAGN